MGVFTLFGQALTVALTADTTTYTMGVQFQVSQAATITAVWWYSPPGAAVLPGSISLYAVSGRTLVHSETATWSGAAGSGWVRAPFTAPPVLTPGTAYKACINSPGGNSYGTIAHYWDTGAGQNGISNGPLSATNNAGGDGGQDTFDTAPPHYPLTSSNASNYLVDPEVTAAGGGDDGGYLLYRAVGIL